MKFNESIRQVIHIIVCLTFAILYNYNVINWLHVLIILIVAILYGILYKQYQPKFLKKYMELVERPKDLEKFPNKGGITLMIGIMLSIALFPQKIAITAIIILGFVDGIPPLIAQKWHKYRYHLNKIKHWEGLISGWIIAILISSLFIWWPWAIISSTVASFVESLDLSIGPIKIEDNIAIPLIAGIVLILMI